MDCVTATCHHSYRRTVRLLCVNTRTDGPCECFVSPLVKTDRANAIPLVQTDRVTAVILFNVE
ncbi:hypothetical protein DPMN_021530 [Dreissena polymorpha]|uniref:Uncharacterized protein n=1 Tax=Dreissena polymorpha TaxID=45954 RepID=A0A9D4NPC4_DREPO|nr:hypothetical protein DPMN_021530 [Dreissena polymorpha]